LVPDDLNGVTDDQFGQTVKRVELAEGGRPVEIAPTVGGQNDGKLVAFRSAKVGDAPDTGFKDLFPVGTLVDGPFDANFVDNQTIIFGKGRIDIGKRGLFNLPRPLFDKRGGKRDILDGGGDGGGEGVGGAGEKTVIKMGPGGKKGQDDGGEPQNDTESDEGLAGKTHIYSVARKKHPGWVLYLTIQFVSEFWLEGQIPASSLGIT